MSDKAAVLTFLAAGDALAYDIALEVGWPPRSAYSRLRALEARGLIRRHRFRYDALANEWLVCWSLTKAGRKAHDLVTVGVTQ